MTALTRLSLLVANKNTFVTAKYSFAIKNECNTIGFRCMYYKNPFFVLLLIKGNRCDFCFWKFEKMRSGNVREFRDGGKEVATLLLVINGLSTF